MNQCDLKDLRLRYLQDDRLIALQKQIADLYSKTIPVGMVKKYCMEEIVLIYSDDLQQAVKRAQEQYNDIVDREYGDLVRFII